MQAATTTPRRFRWEWILAGIVATFVVGSLEPAYNPEGRPFSTWLTLMFMPYGIISSESGFFRAHMDLWPLEKVLALAPLPLYGLVLALLYRTRYFRVGCHLLLVMHTVAACVAAMMYYR